MGGSAPLGNINAAQKFSSGDIYANGPNSIRANVDYSSLGLNQIVQGSNLFDSFYVGPGKVSTRGEDGAISSTNNPYTAELARRNFATEDQRQKGFANEQNRQATLAATNRKPTTAPVPITTFVDTPVDPAAKAYQDYLTKFYGALQPQQSAALKQVEDKTGLTRGSTGPLSGGG